MNRRGLLTGMATHRRRLDSDHRQYIMRRVPRVPLDSSARTRVGRIASGMATIGTGWIRVKHSSGAALLSGSRQARGRGTVFDPSEPHLTGPRAAQAAPWLNRDSSPRTILSFIVYD